MKSLLILAPVVALSAFQPAFAQTNTVATPTTLEPTYGKPQIKVLKTEDNGPSHYEKWQERTLVVLGNVSPSADGKTCATTELKVPTFNLQIQSDQTEADFSKRWNYLKEELGTITTATPDLKRWELSHAVSKSETTIPAQTLVPTLKSGYVYYTWVTRTIEMEGVHADEDTMYKATMNVKVDKPTTKPIKAGRTFNMDTGEIIAEPK